jgi:hypothetical protein
MGVGQPFELALPASILALKSVARAACGPPLDHDPQPKDSGLGHDEQRARLALSKELVESRGGPLGRAPHGAPERCCQFLCCFGGQVS